MTRRLGIFSVNQTELCKLLRLPEGTVILASRQSEYSDRFEFKIEHPDLAEVAEGCSIPEVNSVYHVHTHCYDEIEIVGFK